MKRNITMAILGSIALLLFAIYGKPYTLAHRCLVRAVLLESLSGEFCVGVIYQDVTASADASKAGEQLKLAQGKGESLAAAFAHAETKLPQPADYKLCDYVLLCGSSGKSALDAYLALLLEDKENGRFAAYLYAVEHTVQEVCRQSEANDTALLDWLDTLHARRANSPRVYQAGAPSLLIPYYEQNEAEVPAWSNGALLLHNAAVQRIDETGAQLLYLLQQKQRRTELQLHGNIITLSAISVCKTCTADGTVCISAYINSQPGVYSTAQLQAELNTLANDLVASCGKTLEDLLGTQKVRALAGAADRGTLQIEFKLSGRGAMSP